jgi:hypothetical protein
MPVQHNHAIVPVIGLPELLLALLLPCMMVGAYAVSLASKMLVLSATRTGFR